MRDKIPSTRHNDHHATATRTKTAVEVQIGKRFSLSPRERVGVRGKGAFFVRMILSRDDSVVFGRGGSVRSLRFAFSSSFPSRPSVKETTGEQEITGSTEASSRPRVFE